MARVGAYVNSYSLQSSNIVTRKMYHDSSPAIRLDTLDVPYRDGSRLVSKSFSPKTITFTGIIKGTGIDNLEANIDEFKRYLNVDNSTLDIEYAGSYRRYNVVTESVVIERDFFNVTFAPYSVTFRVLDLPFGYEVSALNGSLSISEIFSSGSLTSQTLDETVTLAGSAKPAPVFNFIVDKPSSLKSIKLTNKSTQQYVRIEESFASGDRVVIDTERLMATINGNNVDYDGVMPEFNIGENKLEVYLEDTIALYDSFTFHDCELAASKGRYIGFEPGNIPATSTTPGKVTRIELLLKKDKNFSATGRVRIKLVNANLSTVYWTKYIDGSLLSYGFRWAIIQLESAEEFTIADTGGDSPLILVEPETYGDIIYFASTRAKNHYAYNASGIAIISGDEHTSTFDVLSMSGLVYKLYIKNTTSYWQVDCNAKYTKRYL